MVTPIEKAQAERDSWARLIAQQVARGDDPRQEDVRAYISSRDRVQELRSVHR